MARIRTIKPEFFRHAGLYDAEKETGLPMRVAFAGLWTACDREGRFEWKPRELKLDCLPHDEIDFSRVLDALRTRGHIEKYVIGKAEYGFVPSWKDHQFINNRETKSTLPAPTETSIAAATCTREARVSVANGTPLEHAQVEGKGREGEGKGKEIATTPDGDGSPTKARTFAKEPGRTKATWAAYSEAYKRRYDVEPVANRTINGQLAQFIDRIPADEAPLVAAHFVNHDGNLYVAAMHPVNLLLRDAEKLRTEWATGRQVRQGNGHANGHTRKDIQLETAALMTGAGRRQPMQEVIDVTPATIAS